MIEHSVIRPYSIIGPQKSYARRNAEYCLEYDLNPRHCFLQSLPSPLVAVDSFYSAKIADALSLAVTGRLVSNPLLKSLY